MVQNHIRYNPISCSCIIDVLQDSDTGALSLFAIKNMCPAHAAIATPDPDFETKKAAMLAKRYQDLDDNRNTNYQQIDAYADSVMSPGEKAANKAIVDRITGERKREYDTLAGSNLIFCINVHDSVKEESGRIAKIYDRVQTFYGLTNDQMGTIVWSFTGAAPNRMFNINFFSLLTNTQKNALRTWCNTNLGTGRVSIL